jgi:hypothetical protein
LWVAICSISTAMLTSWVFYFSLTVNPSVVTLLNRILRSYNAVLTLYLMLILMGGVLRSSNRLTDAPPLGLFPSLPRPKPALLSLEDMLEGGEERWAILPEVIAARSQSIVEIFTIPFESVRFYLGTALLGVQCVILYGSVMFRSL